MLWRLAESYTLLAGSARVDRDPFRFGICINYLGEPSSCKWIMLEPMILYDA